uniref:Solute carrier family 43 member 3 n=1 Tax=Calidris pygmaea TaxID=425635 RepID=A0A8C3PIS3_9CHAR
MAGGGAGVGKRLGTLVSGLLECGAFCGIIFGWASLVFVLKDLGYFEDLCEPLATDGPNHTLLPGRVPGHPWPPSRPCGGPGPAVPCVLVSWHADGPCPPGAGGLRFPVSPQSCCPRSLFFLSPVAPSCPRCPDALQCPVSLLSLCPCPCCPPRPDALWYLISSLSPCPCCPDALCSSLSPCPHCPRVPSDGIPADCSRQDEQFSLVFTIGSFMNNFMTFPMGFIFDRFGTAVARLIAISLYTGGTLLVAFSTPELAVLLFPAMSMLSVGGILLILTNMQVLYERGLSLRAMFLFMAACSAWHLLRTLFLMPRSRIPYPLPPAYDYGLQCPGRSRSYRTYEEKRPPGESGPEETPLEPTVPRGGGDPPGVPFGACVRSGLFAWHVAWLSVMQLRHYLFIGTLNPLLDHLAHGDHHLVSTYTNAFAFTQLCGVLCAPWNGLILDRHKRGKAPRPEGALGALADLRASVLSLAVTVTQCLLFSICAAVPVLPVQFATFVLQVLSRSFLYGGNAAFLAIAFPPQHFGKLYGLAMALSALVALLQYPCVALVRGPLHGDPFYVNVGLIAVVLVAFVSPVVVARECQRRAKELGAAGTPLAAPPDTETPAEASH